MERPVLPSTKSPWFQYPEDLDPVLRDVRDNLDVLDSDVDDIQSGALPIALAGIAGALGEYEPLDALLETYKVAANYGIPTDGVTPAGAAINAAITQLDTRTPGGNGILTIPPGKYIIEETIEIPPRFRFLGSGGGGSLGAYGGTEFVAANGLNANMFESKNDEWWHWGELAYFSINGNKANNTTGSGVAIRHVGETSTIHNIQASSCAEHGFYIHGESTPTSLMDCSAMSNGKSGFFFDAFTRHCTLINPSGDSNADSLISISGNGNNGAISFVNIIGIKSEAGAAGKQSPAVKIDNYVGAVNFVGGSIDGNISGGGTSLVGVQRTGAYGGNVAFMGTRVSGYATQYQDDVQTTNTVALGTNTHTLSGQIGKTMFDIETGAHFSGRLATAPTPSALAPAGSGATASVGAGTDVRGTLTLTTGTGPSSGSVARLTFGRAYQAAPRIMLLPNNAAAAGVMGTVYSVLADGTKVDIAVSSALAASTEYKWDYMVMG